MKTREIKFKIWDDARKEWVHEDPISILGETIICGEILRRPNDSSVKLENLNDLICLQFTGLLDKNGGEAYYGDIIEHSTTEGGIFRRIISWDDELQCTMIDGFPYYRLHESGYIQPSKLVFEIIGNIYENPDLLK